MASCYMTSPFKYKAPIRTSLSRVLLMTRISQCTVKNVHDEAERHVGIENDQAHELPAPWHQRPPRAGDLPERGRGGSGAPRDAAALERGGGRGRRAHAPAEPLQDRRRDR